MKEILSYCQEKISSRRIENPKIFWNYRAEEFYNRYLNETKAEEPFFTIIDRKKILNSKSVVLDIGCGVGRHATSFLKHSASYVGIDISDKMIEYANKTKNELNLKNAEFKIGDWSLENPKYDLVFSSMCPAIDSVEALKKYSEISKGYCMINRFISNKDSLSELMEIEYLNKVHNNPDIVYAMVTILWQLGYFPQVEIFESTKNIKSTTKDTLDFFLVWNERSSLRKGKEIKKIINEKSRNGKIEYKQYSKWAVIYWKVNKL